MSDIKGVHCPLDFSDTSRHALAQAAAVAGWYKARLAALHAYSPMFMPIPGLPAPANRVPEFKQQLKSATNRLESFASDAIRDRCAVTARVSHGKPYVEILRVAADKGPTLSFWASMINRRTEHRQIDHLPTCRRAKPDTTGSRANASFA